MADRKKKRVRNWFSRKLKRKHKRDRRIAILPTLGVINLGTYALSAGNKLDVLKHGDVAGYAKWVMKDALVATTGYNPETKTWDWTGMWAGTIPIIIGALGSKVMTAIGVNRYMSKLPIIGKRVKL